MARHKPSGKKKHLSHALRQAQPVPSWVVAKTEGKVRRTPKQRHWRKTKIKVKTPTNNERKQKKKTKATSKKEKGKPRKTEDDALVERPAEVLPVSVWM